MSVRIRILVLSAFLTCPGILLLAQHHGGGGGGSHSAMSSGHFGAAAPFAPHFPSYPSASANSIGIPASAYSIGFPAQSYGLPPAVYPSYSHAYGSNYYSNAGAYGKNYSNAGAYGKNGHRSRYGYAGVPYFPLLGYFDNGFYDAPPPYPATYEGDPSLGGPPSDVSGLSEQVQQLSAQLNDLQSQLSQRSPSASGSVPDTSPQQTAPEPPLTVVLNNGQTLQIQNYAVMGDTLWDLSSQPSHRIPVSSIDIPASTKASEASGAEFPQLSPKPRS